jgi:hypothetical protein
VPALVDPVAHDARRLRIATQEARLPEGEQPNGRSLTDSRDWRTPLVIGDS